jgi:hypothetical protein
MSVIDHQEQINTYLLLSIAHLLPLGTEELADLTERGIGVLLLDSLSVVLDKEHVGGKGSVLSAMVEMVDMGLTAWA